MTKPLVILTHTLPDEWITSLHTECEVVAGPQDATQFDPKLTQYLPRAEGLFTLLTIPVNEDLLSQAPQLRVVSNMAVGVDNIDLPACTRRRIPVGNTPGVLTHSTADLTMALMLSIARNLPLASLDAREGRWKTWSPAGWLGIELHGSTLGIIGMGKIGQAVAQRALGFGMQVIFSDPEPKQVINTTQSSLDELFQRSDFISLHAPLTPDTRGMINHITLSRMKPSAVLINAARGSLVDMAALTEALRHHKIAAAALDVTDPEPLPPSHPLFSLPNCLIVPHIGSATYQTRRKMAELACANLLAGLKGEPLPHCVNPEVNIPEG
ncbi:MAG: D-glycerate dehydrogenase [Anaerolineales bacterium]|nr:MAG: D-glycerate dehydrogenase [Anaerolineales bacterium]